MINVERPDLSGADAGVVAYVEALEAELVRLTTKGKRKPAAVLEPGPSEPPTTLNVITISDGSAAKRTPRHLYTLQRRGGMGVFGMQVGKDGFAAVVAVADEEENLLLFSKYL